MLHTNREGDFGKLTYRSLESCLMCEEGVGKSNSSDEGTSPLRRAIIHLYQSSVYLEPILKVKRSSLERYSHVGNTENVAQDARLNEPFDDG